MAYLSILMDCNNLAIKHFLFTSPLILPDEQLGYYTYYKVVIFMVTMLLKNEPQGPKGPLSSLHNYKTAV